MVVISIVIMLLWSVLKLVFEGDSPGILTSISSHTMVSGGHSSRCHLQWQLWLSWFCYDAIIVAAEWQGICRQSSHA